MDRQTEGQRAFLKSPAGATGDNDGQTDGQPETIMPPDTKVGRGIMTASIRLRLHLNTTIRGYYYKIGLESMKRVFIDLALRGQVLADQHVFGTTTKVSERQKQCCLNPFSFIYSVKVIFFKA